MVEGILSVLNQFCWIFFMYLMSWNSIGTCLGCARLPTNHQIFTLISLSAVHAAFQYLHIEVSFAFSLLYSSTHLEKWFLSSLKSLEVMTSSCRSVSCVLTDCKYKVQGIWQKLGSSFRNIVWYLFKLFIFHLKLPFSHKMQEVLELCVFC